MRLILHYPLFERFKETRKVGRASECSDLSGVRLMQIIDPEELREIDFSRVQVNGVPSPSPCNIWGIF